MTENKSERARKLLTIAAYLNSQLLIIPLIISQFAISAIPYTYPIHRCMYIKNIEHDTQVRATRI